MMIVSTNTQKWVGLREVGSGANRKGTGMGRGYVAELGSDVPCLTCPWGV